jgi:hypothetical protein
MRKWSYDGNEPGGPIRYIGLVLADEKVNFNVFLKQLLTIKIHPENYKYVTMQLYFLIFFPYIFLCYKHIYVVSVFLNIFNSKYSVLCREIPFMVIL